MVKDLKLNFKGNSLKGTAQIPSGEGKFKTVIMFHEFGLNKKGKLDQFLSLEKKLIEEEIVIVRFDFLGHGESDGDISKITTTSLVEQGKAIVNLVKELEFVNINNISLLGEGFGAIIASIVAGEMKNEIEEICLWNPDVDLVNEVKVRKLIKGVPIYKFYKQRKINIDNLLVGLDFVKDLEIYPYHEKATMFNKNIKIIEKTKISNKSKEFTRELLNCYNKENKIADLYEVNDDDKSLEKEVNFKILDESLKFFLINN